MGNHAIVIERLSKQYRLRGVRSPYETLRESLQRAFTAPARWLAGSQSRSGTESFWALSDVSAEIERGDIVGIVGRNGAGKSTLLKILSRVTEPTVGEARVFGTLGALLEVGTGFHPELSGRQNVYLSGAILGMTRREIQRRFDEIVAFAEIERFLDVPIKRYSSGMYTRLAFSVAAHLDPEILLVDEVLAVGDAAFQKKCLKRMESVSREGRTILFVSHSMPSVLRLCNRALLLEEGRLTRSGSPADVVSAYLQEGTGRCGERIWASRVEAPGNHVARLHAVRVLNQAGEVADAIEIRQPFTVELDYWNESREVRPSAYLQFYNDQGVCLFITGDFQNPSWQERTRRRGLVRSICHIPGNFLAEGRVIVRMAAVLSFDPPVFHAQAIDPVSFQVIDRSDGDGARGPYRNDYLGVVRPLLKWELQDDAGGAA